MKRLMAATALDRWSIERDTAFSAGGDCRQW
jgi:hypothetical protein